MRLSSNPNLPHVEPVYCEQHQPEWGADPTNWCLEFHGYYYPFGFRDTAVKALTWWSAAVASGKMYRACESCAAGANAPRIPRRMLRRPVFPTVKFYTEEPGDAAAS